MKAAAFLLLAGRIALHLLLMLVLALTRRRILATCWYISSAIDEHEVIVLGRILVCRKMGAFLLLSFCIESDLGVH